MKLFKHQKDLLDLNPSKYLLAHGTGTGKTRTAIELAKKNCKWVMIICPKALVENWKREIAKWASEREDMQWFVISKDQFRIQRAPGYHNPKGVSRVNLKFDGLIIDEAHGVANTKSQIHKAVEKYINEMEVKFIWALTATPYLSSAWNIFALAKILGHKWSWIKFKSEYFYDVQMGRRVVPIQKPGIENEIAALVNRIGNTVKMEDITDIPEQSFESEYLSLTEKQEKAIKNLDDITFIARFTKQHQIENGCLKGNGYLEDAFFSSLKFDRLAEICDESPKVAIFCRYNLQLEGIKQFLDIHFEGKRRVYVINGDEPNKDEVVQVVEADPSAVVVINAACSEGYQLPSIGIIVYASLSFSLKDSIQSQGRFLRADRLKKNLYIYLISGEVDEAVYASIMNKQDFHMAIFAKERQNLALHGSIDE